jgi:LPXTG-motif cell wall-anchored protein
MKNTVSAAVALPTVIVIALGGLLMTAPAAHAGTAPIGQLDEGTAPAGQVEEGTTPSGEPDGAERADDTAPVVDGGAADEGEASQPGPASVAGALPPQEVVAEVAAEPTSFTVSSPVDGAVLTSAGVVVSGDVPVGSTLSIATSPDENGAFLPGSGPQFSERFELSPSTVPVQHVVSVQVTGPDGVDLGTVVRHVTVPAMTALPAPVLTSPRVGDTVVARPGVSGDFRTGEFTMAGTGAVGAVLDVDLASLGPVVSWGYDDEPAVVGADGRWSEAVWMPAGTWRLSVGQQTYDADGFATSLPSSTASVDVRVVEPAAVALPQPAVAGVAVPPVPGATTVAAAPPRTLASTGTDESTAWGGLAGTALVVVGGLVLAAAGRRRRA